MELKSQDFLKKVFISNKVKKLKSWTAEEDTQLLILADKYNCSKWGKVAEELKNRTAIQCTARYARIRPGLIKGSWSKNDDSLVLSLIEKFGKNWSLISKYLPSRTGKQIRDRYLNSLDNQLNKGKFSEEEDSKIIDLYLQYGTQWSKIAKFFERRNGDIIKNRFYSTIRRKIHPSDKEVKRLKKKVGKKQVAPEILVEQHLIKIDEPVKVMSDDSTCLKTETSKKATAKPENYVREERTSDVTPLITKAEISLDKDNLLLKLKQVESSMNSSMSNYLIFLKQYQVMNSLLNTFAPN